PGDAVAERGMADGRIEPVADIVGEGLREDRPVVARQQRAIADRADPAGARMEIGELGAVGIALIARLGPVAIAWLEDQRDEHAEAVAAREIGREARIVDARAQAPLAVDPVVDGRADPVAVAPAVPADD